MGFLFSFSVLCILVVFSVILFYCYFWDLNYSVFCNVRSWSSSFECGFLSEGVSENYFSCSYFILLVFFVLFDLEVSLLLNIPFQLNLYKNFGFYFLFILILCLGYFFEVECGYLKWGP